MKMRALGILAIVAMVATLFTSAGAQAKEPDRVYSFDIFSMTLPDDTEAYTRDDGASHPEGIQYMFDNLPNMCLGAFNDDPPVLFLVLVSRADNEIDFGKLDESDVQSRLLPTYQEKWASMDGEVIDSGYEMMPSGPYLYLFASQGKKYAYTYFTQTEYEGVIYEVAIRSLESENQISDERLSFLRNVVQTIELHETGQASAAQTGDGPDDGEKSDRRAASFEVDGHVVELEIPSYLEVDPDSRQFDFEASGICGSTNALIRVDCLDVWNALPEDINALYGFWTRADCKASYENQISLYILDSFCEDLDLEGTYIDFNGAVYIVAFESEIDGTQPVHKVHFATLINGALFRFHFIYTGPEPDDDATIQSMMETVSYSYTGTD
jgi:hypothetical protein